VVEEFIPKEYIGHTQPETIIKKLVTKKNEMLRLMTVKISTFCHKDTIDGKDYDWKDLQIAWNEEISGLFLLGIFEQEKKNRAKNPAYAGSLIQFNSQKIRDG
jgi:hypothetical protein